MVEVQFDPRVVGFARLLERARKSDCAARVFTRTDAQQKLAAAVVGKRAVRCDDRLRGVDDEKYHLLRTPLKYLPMTAAQAARVNAAVGDAKRWLSPRQIELLARIEKKPDAGWPVAVGVGLAVAWRATAGIDGAR